MDSSFYRSKLEEIVHQKSAAEHELFETNEENRVLKHECSRSSEDKKIAESLVETVKNQLARSDERLNKLVVEVYERRYQILSAVYFKLF